MKNSDSNLILYAKGHYEENDLWKDLAKILGERNLLEESYLNKQLIFENVVSITLDYIGTSQTKIFELMREIQPSYFWRWSGSINFEKDPDDYDFYYASVRKCLSLLSMLPVIGKNDEILIELDPPDYSILPISENSLRRTRKKKMSKIRLTFKTPDVAYYALQDIRDEDEREKAEEVIKKFVRNDEYIGIEIDTEAGTAKVLEQ